MLSDEVRDSPLPLSRFIDLGESCSRKPRAPRALTAGDLICRGQMGPSMPKWPDACARSIIMTQQPISHDTPSHAPPTSSTTRGSTA
jgi:hypothetical protein